MPSTLNVRDAESAFLTGKAIFQEWLEGFMESWEAPALASMEAAVLSRIPPEAVDMLVQQKPEVMERIRQRLEGKNYG